MVFVDVADMLVFQFDVHLNDQRNCYSPRFSYCSMAAFDQWVDQVGAKLPVSDCPSDSQEEV